MNKVILRVLVLFLVIAIVCIFLVIKRAPFGKSNSSFSVGPGKEITRIELSKGDDKTTLEKKGETWLINGKSEARKSGINFIIIILTEIKIKSPVSDELFKIEITDKNLTPVKVRAYENRSLIGTFLVYKTRSNVYGNIMKIKESSKPFIVYVPGYDGDIGSAFILNELYWQPYTVFSLLPSEIGSVNFENFSDTTSSFSILNRNRHYSIPGLDNDHLRSDSSLVIRYISYFARVPFESWAFDIGDAERKSIEGRQPLYRISVITTTGKKQVLTLWTILTGETEQKEIDSNRLIGKTDDRDQLFILRYFDIDPLIKKRSYFFPQ